jgi:hypothetical protein
MDTALFLYNIRESPYTCPAAGVSVFMITLEG